jgi:hypothetical protein
MSTIEMSRVNLDAPAFSAEPKEEGTSEIATPEAPLAESGEEKEPSTSGDEPVVEEQRVPYSRMKAVIDRAREAEQRAEEAEERLSRQRSEPRERSYEPANTGEVKAYSGALPSYWVGMYGDDERSRLGYSYELERQNTIREEVRREAIEAVREERTTESRVIAQNERTIDQRLEDLSSSLGRDLTEQEESALLDIVDEYTPKDQEGNYAGDLIPMDKAYEILSMKQSQGSQRSTRGRREATAATSSRTQSEAIGSDKNNSDWNPRDWNSYKKRIPN